MKLYAKKLRDGLCTVNATLPESRAEIEKAVAAMSDDALSNLVHRAVTHWWNHSAPKSKVLSKGAKPTPVKVAYGSEDAPIDLPALMALAALAAREEKVVSFDITAEDRAAAGQRLTEWRILWRAENKLPADASEAAQAAHKQALASAMQARIEALAVEKCAAFPELEWEWNSYINSENPDTEPPPDCPVTNLARLGAALRVALHEQEKAEKAEKTARKKAAGI